MPVGQTGGKTEQPSGIPQEIALEPRRRFRVFKRWQPRGTPAARETLIHTVGIDNIWNAIEVATGIYLDIRKALKDDEKISFAEALGMAIRRGPGLIKVFTNLKELGLEFVDLDQDEREILTQRFSEKFHVSDKNAEYRVELIFDFGLWLVAGITDFIEAWGQTPEPTPES